MENEFMRKQMTIRSFLLAIVAMVLLSAACVHAQSVDIWVNQTVATQCGSGEAVALTGNLHFGLSVTTTDNTTDPPTVTNHYNVTIASALTGVGQTSKAAYAENSSYGYNFGAADSSVQFTLQLQAPLISPGTAPVMVLQRSVQITVDSSGNISASVPSSSTACIDQPSN